jgi:hypothetical protein
MTFQEKFEYFIMLLMCLFVAFGMYWMALELRKWGKPTAETRYVDTGYACTEKY